MGCTSSSPVGGLGDRHGAKDTFEGSSKAPAVSGSSRGLGRRHHSFSSISKAGTPLASGATALEHEKRAAESAGNHLKLQAGVVKDSTGKSAGRLDKKGGWYTSGNDRRGTFRRDGTVADAQGTPCAHIDEKGEVWNAKRKVSLGRIARDGSVISSTEVVGHVTADGAAFDVRGRRMGMCSAGVKQAAFIFFFSDGPDGRSPKLVTKAATR